MMWKDIVGYEGIYQINRYGDIKNRSRIIEKFLKPSYNSGYPRVLLNKNGIQTSHQVSKLYVDTFYPDVEDKEMISLIKRGINEMVIDKLKEGGYN